MVAPVGAGKQLIVDGVVHCTTNADGFCVASDGRTLGAMFTDGAMLTAPWHQFPYADFLAQTPVQAGIFRWQSEEFQVVRGELLDANDRSRGFVTIDGAVQLLTSHQSWGGHITELPDVSAQLYMYNQRVYRSPPPATPQSRAVRFPFIRTVDHQQLVSWTGFVLQRTRDGITVSVRLQPLRSAGRTWSAAERAVLESTMNAALAHRFGGWRAVATTGNAQFAIRVEIPLQFRVILTNDADQADATIDIFEDVSLACIQPAAGGAPHCHTIRPSMFAISREAIAAQFPHEYLHHLGAADEYPDAHDPQRVVTDAGSIMHSHAGAVRASHLERVRRELAQWLELPVTLMVP